MGKIILASSSPRRRDILKKAKYNFTIIPSEYEEQHTQTDFSYEFVEGLAYNKAKAVADIIDEPALVIGADTIVVSENKILEKPKDEDDAIKMLKKLSDKTHSVVTSIAVINTETKECRQKNTVSHVTFNALSGEMIINYVREFKPYDKAGGYGIQELPEGFVKSYEGSFENIMGLCPKTLKEILD